MPAILSIIVFVVLAIILIKVMVAALGLIIALLFGVHRLFRSGEARGKGCLTHVG